MLLNLVERSKQTKNSLDELFMSLMVWKCLIVSQNKFKRTAGGEKDVEISFHDLLHQQLNEVYDT